MVCGCRRSFKDCAANPRRKRSARGSKVAPGLIGQLSAQRRCGWASGPGRRVHRPAPECLGTLLARLIRLSVRSPMPRRGWLLLVDAIAREQVRTIAIEKFVDGCLLPCARACDAGIALSPFGDSAGSRRARRGGGAELIELVRPHEPVESPFQRALSSQGVRVASVALRLRDREKLWATCRRTWR